MESVKSGSIKMVCVRDNFGVYRGTALYARKLCLKIFYFILQISINTYIYIYILQNVRFYYNIIGIFSSML